MEKKFFVTNEKYKEGFVLSEYKGRWQLIAAKQGSDKVFEKWGEIEISKDKTKKLPVSIDLGEKPVEVLRSVIESLIETIEAPF